MVITVGAQARASTRVWVTAVYARAAITGKIKSFGDSQRDGSAYGRSIGLKERLSPSFWLREFGEYEKNSADSAIFSYAGMKLGAETGVSMTRSSLLSEGNVFSGLVFNEIRQRH